MHYMMLSVKEAAVAATPAWIPTATADTCLTTENRFQVAFGQEPDPTLSLEEYFSVGTMYAGVGGRRRGQEHNSVLVGDTASGGMSIKAVPMQQL
ncbi:hypothetical protein P7K49_026489 [Saguinus oedipus]|uniref:Uncharacterized protein n=1 Tax=Saguinus oedipus TaxID=9490 RepID=A0ABQ9UDC1_SAGOE|nr:hypothetical protein P7K49_026489 [Saguinus oedipus]